jgi:hypothetical protein
VQFDVGSGRAQVRDGLENRVAHQHSKLAKVTFLKIGINGVNGSDIPGRAVDVEHRHAEFLFDVVRDDARHIAQFSARELP